MYIVEQQYSMRNICRERGEPHWHRDAPNDWETIETGLTEIKANKLASMIKDSTDPYMRVYSRVRFISEAR